MLFVELEAILIYELHSIPKFVIALSFKNDKLHLGVSPDLGRGTVFYCPVSIHYCLKIVKSSYMVEMSLTHWYFLFQCL